jgi:2-dehydropantoate 2-reductase
MAGKMLAIDPLSRSSMWEDLEAGRVTEIDYLNGEIVRLAEKLGRTAPVNTRLITLIRDAETDGRRVWSGEELRNELNSARHRPLTINDSKSFNALPGNS